METGYTSWQSLILDTFTCIQHGINLRLGMLIVVMGAQLKATELVNCSLQSKGWNCLKGTFGWGGQSAKRLFIC